MVPILHVSCDLQLGVQYRSPGTVGDVRYLYCTPYSVRTVQNFVICLGEINIKKCELTNARNIVFY